MIRINVSFNTYVPTIHPFVMMRLISALSVLELFGLRITLAPQGLHLPGIGKFSIDPTQPLGSLAPALSDEAKKALDIANVHPSQAVVGLAPVLSDAAKDALAMANIRPDQAITSVEPKLPDEANNTLDLAKAMHSHISTQLFNGQIDEKDALAAQATLFKVAKPSVTKLGF